MEKNRIKVIKFFNDTNYFKIFKYSDETKEFLIDYASNYGLVYKNRIIVNPLKGKIDLSKAL